MSDFTIFWQTAFAGAGIFALTAAPLADALVISEARGYRHPRWRWFLAFVGLGAPIILMIYILDLLRQGMAPDPGVWGSKVVMAAFALPYVARLALPQFPLENFPAAAPTLVAKPGCAAGSDSTCSSGSPTPTPPTVVPSSTTATGQRNTHALEAATAAGLILAGVALRRRLRSQP